MNTKMLPKFCSRQFKGNWIFQENIDPKLTAKLDKESIKKKKEMCQSTSDKIFIKLIKSQNDRNA